MAEVIHTRKGKYQYKYEHTREGDKVVSRYMYPADGKGNETKPYKDRVAQQDKYGFKTDLSESEIEDRKRLGKLMIEADKEINKVKHDPKKYKEFRKASEKYQKVQEELYNKYGVY